MPGARRGDTPAPARVVIVALAAALALAPAACAQEPAEPTAPPAIPTSAPPAARSAPATGAAPVDPAAACVDGVLRRLDVRERAAQLVMAGVPADGLTAGGRAALARGVGGVILTDAAGGEASRDQVAATVREIQQTAPIPVTIATDQEGGRVQDLAGDGFSRIPAAATQGRDVAGLRDDARGWAREMADAGVTLDLAPVADVVDPALGDDNAPVGALDRGFGTNPQRVGAAVTAFVQGMDAGGVATTLKHFPGLGRVRDNTDFGDAADEVTTVDDPGLDSFRAGIAAGAPVVMMSSAVYARIDPDDRALFSRTVVTDLLRGRLGFDGVVTTDDVGAAAALADVPVGERAVRFVQAGGDQVLTVRAADVDPMVTALAREADGDPEFSGRLEQSARRILTLKSARGLVRCSESPTGG
ncbi:glycoside hydrolase family 3 N-terminal domain-containing protein [Actinomycetospora sp. CA-101289]|uniref:glycoside hydrolase family 3 N-terminal domain-containing protein n=1 Tax=Actinomycetospora sp. CA-101289 TaxID=3239893 RepID=UPI003D97E990